MIEQIKTEDGWYVIFNNELLKNLSKSIESALLNAEDILFEANLLYEHSKFARAAALAILAEEEFAKAILLKECTQIKIWNSFYFKIIKQHPEKQATSEYISYLLSKIKRIDEDNKFRFIPMTVENYIFPGSSEIQDFKSKLQEHTIKKKKRDIYKQSMFYTNISKKGIVTSSPHNISQKEAAICLDSADRVKEFAKFIHENLPIHQLDKRFRQLTTWQTNYSTYWTIRYKEGFDLSLDLFNFNFSSRDNAKEKIQNFLDDIRIIENHLKENSSTLPRDVLVRCQKFVSDHKILKQIQEQKKKLGIRYSLLEEAVELSLNFKISSQ